jgi:hypothetical protein
MIVIGLDPGYLKSAYALFDGRDVAESETIGNEAMLDYLGVMRAERNEFDGVLVLEQIACFGMPVGAEVLETCVWSGRFIEAWERWGGRWDRVKRHEVKTALCRNSRAKDAHIRQALIDRFGPTRQQAIGTRRAPGPLYGVVGDQWAALAVAVVYWDRVHGVRASA